MKRLLAALLALLLPVDASAGDCPLDLGHGTGLVVYTSHYMLAFRTEPIQVFVGQPFALIMNVCTRPGDAAELVRVEASLLEPKHSMNTPPIIVPLGNGRYRVEGLTLPVPGSWELAFDVRSGEEIERLSHDIIVK